MSEENQFLTRVQNMNIEGIGSIEIFKKFWRKDIPMKRVLKFQNALF